MAYLWLIWNRRGHAIWQVYACLHVTACDTKFSMHVWWGWCNVTSKICLIWVWMDSLKEGWRGNRENMDFFFKHGKYGLKSIFFLVCLFISAVIYALCLGFKNPYARSCMYYTTFSCNKKLVKYESCQKEVEAADWLYNLLKQSCYRDSNFTMCMHKLLKLNLISS